MADSEKIKTEDANLFLRGICTGKMSSSLFSATMLAYWDNVMGPLISKVWKGNDKVEINDDIISYVSNHTLSGELCRQTEKNTIDPKLYILEDLGYIFFAVIFNGHSKMGQTISSLSFIMSYKDLNRYLLLQDFIGKQVKLMVLKHRVFQQKNLGSSVKEFARLLKTFIKTVDSLQDLNVPEKICINDTIFGEGDDANDAGLLDSKFLMASLTSHLQTCGCTIVLGESPEKINLFIRTLSLFSCSSERYCSRYACSKGFTRDLWIQGMLKDEKEDGVKDASKEILLNTYPITLIDIDKKTVSQKTSSLNEHSVQRVDFIKAELGLLLQNWEAPAFYPYLGIFTEDFGDISIMVQRFITELFAIPNKCSIRRSHIENLLFLLKQKASSLLVYVEAKSNMGKVAFDYTQLQQLKQDLSLNSESDFRIVLAAAEKLRPGFAVFLVGEVYKREVNYQSSSISRIKATTILLV